MLKKITKKDIKNFKDIRILSRRMKLFFDKEIRPKQLEFNREFKRVVELVKVVQWTRRKRNDSFFNRLDFWIHATKQQGLFYTLKMLLIGERYMFKELAKDYWNIKFDKRTLDLLENMVDVFSTQSEEIYFDDSLSEEEKYAQLYEDISHAKFLNDELIGIKKELEDIGKVDKYAKAKV